MQYQSRYMRRWTDAKLDALIMPVQPWVAFKPKTWVQSHQNVSYTSHWNFVDFAALAIPAIKASASKDVGSAEWKSDSWTARDVSDEFNHQQYDAELVDGMPVGVQVVGGRFGEERCLAVAKVIEELLARS
jgi:amidase